MQKRFQGKACAFFNTPQGCKDGVSCRFLHVRETKQTTSTDTIIPKIAKVEKVGSPTFHPKRITKKCTFFNTPQGCRNGDSCKFLHVKEEEQTFPTVDNTVDIDKIDAKVIIEEEPIMTGAGDVIAI
jgi:hypothetical protein